MCLLDQVGVAEVLFEAGDRPGVGRGWIGRRRRPVGNSPLRLRKIGFNGGDLRLFGGERFLDGAIVGPLRQP